MRTSRGFIVNDIVFRDRGAAKEMHDRLGTAYYRYLARRYFRDHFLAGTVDLASLGEFVRALVLAMFRVLVLERPGGTDSLGGISVESTLSHGPTLVAGDPGSRLARGGECELGSSLVLGRSIPDEVPRMAIDVRVSAEEMMVLRGRADALTQLMDTLERFLPLHLDFHVEVSVHERDWTFQLPGGEAAGASGPALGLTTGLGMR